MDAYERELRIFDQVCRSAVCVRRSEELIKKIRESVAKSDGFIQNANEFLLKAEKELRSAKQNETRTDSGAPSVHLLSAAAKPSLRRQVGIAYAD